MRLPDAADNLVSAGSHASTPSSPPTQRKKPAPLRQLAATSARQDMAPDDPVKLALDTALDAVVVMGPDGAIAEWNAIAEEIFGWPRAEVAGRQLADVIIPARFRNDHYAGLTRFHATGEGPLLRKRIETTALRRGGEEFPVELSISPLVRGGETRFVGFLRDISERHQSEDLLRTEARRATLLHQLTSFAAQSASVEEALRQCLAAVCEMIGWPLGHALLPTGQEQGELVSSVWHGPPGAFAVFREISDATRFSPGVGLPGEIWQKREPVWIADVKRSGNFPRAQSGHEIGIGAAFGFPIKSGDQVIAVLEFFHPAVREPDDSILLTARALGDQVGRVLERKQDLERQHDLLAELNHRVKNMLAVVVGMATQTARTAETIGAFQESFTGRVMSLSRTYSALTSSEWHRIGLGELLAGVIAPYADAPSERVSLSGPLVALAPKMAIALSIVVHELATNARKFGGLASAGGRLDIAWNRADTASGPAFELIWREFRPGVLEAPEKTRFGLRLVETSVRHELRGTAERSFEADGVRHRFVIPYPGN
jgi:PAS domain S-box-containing protein